MNTVTLHFKADNQQLTALDGLYKLASNTVEYVKAIFTLGENWTGFDVVRAAWYTDFECISTVLDGNGECFVPWEVLSRPEGVTINLYGCDLEEESDGEAVLVDRLTTYPVKAILVDVDARVCGSETKPVTPSQFEQYIAIVQELVGTVRDITSCVLNPDYTLTINYSDDTSDTVGPIRGEQGEQGPTGPAGNGISKIEKISTAGLVDTYRITFTNGTHKDYTVTNGAKGDTGNGIESIYLTGTSGAVKTYTILFTNGDTFEYQVTDGEVTRAELEQVLPTDTASGAIASFPDGSDLFDYLSCVVNIDPVQDLHGYDKPWVGGAGKNKYDKSIPLLNGYVNTSGVIVNPITTEKSAVSGFLKAGTYTMSKQSTTRFRVGLFASEPQVGDTAVQFWTANPQTATSLTFTTPSDGYLCIFIWNGDDAETGTVQEVVDTIQIELGSTATAYEPYSNICPITGWTGCNLVVSPTQDAQDGTTYPVSWQTEAGTVYGGTVDLVTGVLTVTHGIVTFDGTETFSPFGGTYPHLFIYNWSVGKGLNGTNTAQNNISSHFIYRAVYDSDAYYVSADGKTLYLNLMSASSASDVSAFMLAQYNNGKPVQFVSKLATPTKIQLTEQQIACLLGQNNVWADCGDTSVTYKADVQRWVEKKLGA